ncbi:MAG TPA: Gfo/Idh/MocA family oxidoreductase [Chthoniobacterales bacterium]
MQPAKRILLIGLGRWGANHLRVLQSMPIELFVAEQDPERLSASGVPQSHRTSEARSLFPVIDAAVVVTPADSHFEICRELLEAGKDVFVEKPISLKSAEAQQLSELAKRNRLILQVGHIFRFDPASVWMRDAIAEGRFGEIKMLRANFSGFKRPRQDTGVTLADGIHFIDLFQFLLGSEPRRVHAVMKNFLGREGEMDDEALIVLEYEREGVRILATIEAGYHRPGKMRELTIVGKNLSAVCDYNVAQYKIKTFDNRHVDERGEIKASEGAARQLEFPPEEPLRAELAAFLQSIETRKAPLVAGDEGAVALRIVEAAMESARTGKWIDLN